MWCGYVYGCDRCHCSFSFRFSSRFPTFLLVYCVGFMHLSLISSHLISSHLSIIIVISFYISAFCSSLTIPPSVCAHFLIIYLFIVQCFPFFFLQFSFGTSNTLLALKRPDLGTRFKELMKRGVLLCRSVDQEAKCSCILCIPQVVFSLIYILRIHTCVCESDSFSRCTVQV